VHHNVGGRFKISGNRPHLFECRQKTSLAQNERVFTSINSLGWRALIRQYGRKHSLRFIFLAQLGCSCSRCLWTPGLLSDVYANSLSIPPIATVRVDILRGKGYIVGVVLPRLAGRCYRDMLGQQLKNVAGPPVTTRTSKYVPRCGATVPMNHSARNRHRQ